MDQLTNVNPMLELIDRPAFCVQNNQIVQSNHSARQLGITAGMQIDQLLTDDIQAYRDFSNGCLAVTLHVNGNGYPASVTQADSQHIFRIEQDTTAPELKTLSLAAQHIRVPLAAALTVSDQLFSDPADPRAAQLVKALYQTHRLICNISDAARYSSDTASCQMHSANITAIFDEVFEKATAIMEAAGIQVRFTGLEQPVYGLADGEKICRAVYNMLANAAKFAPKGSKIDAKLTRNGDMLHFSVQDEGCGIPQEIIGNVFSRFLRSPMIEDGRNGIGLGIPLIHAVAAAHGGTVLIDQPEGHGARITMTLQIRMNDTDALHAPILPIGDYAGGRDMALLEFSEILPTEAYQNML